MSEWSDWMVVDKLKSSRSGKWATIPREDEDDGRVAALASVKTYAECQPLARLEWPRRKGFSNKGLARSV